MLGDKRPLKESRWEGTGCYQNWETRVPNAREGVELGRGQRWGCSSWAWKEDKSVPGQKVAGILGLGNHRSQKGVLVECVHALRVQGLGSTVTHSVG